MEVDLRESEDLPHKAIHTEILSPFTEVFDPLPLVGHTAIARFTPCDEVLRIQ